MVMFVNDYMVHYTDKIIRLRIKLQKVRNPFWKVFLRRKYNKLVYKNQCFFPLSDDISNNIIFPHGLSGIFISQGAKIGDGCVIFQQVTIGSNSLGDSKGKGCPTIGKNVFIGAGAKIIGNVTVGDNARIGANTVVTKDVPKNATVVGGGFRTISHSFSLDNSFNVYKEK